MFKLMLFGRPPQDEQRGHNPYTSIIESLSQDLRNSVVLLPDNPAIRAAVELFERVLLDGQKIPAYYIPDEGFSIDKMLDENPVLIEQLQAYLDQKVPLRDGVEILFFKQNEYLYSWTAKLKGKLYIIRETADYLTYSTKKTVFHRQIATPNVPAPIEKYAAIHVPHGYVAHNKAEISRAWAALKANNIQHILVKPVDGYLGRGIKFIETQADIDSLPNGSYIVEEKLNLDSNSLCEQDSYSVGFYQKKLFQVTTQLLEGVVYVGSLSDFLGSKALLEDILLQSDAFLTFCIEQGMQNYGGIDFLVANGKAFLVDNNMGRMTAAHSARFFQNTHAPNVPFATFYLENKTHSIDEVWEILQKNNLAFDKKTQKGVFPFSYVPHHVAKMIAFHTTSEEAYTMAMEVKKILKE